MKAAARLGCPYVPAYLLHLLQLLADAGLDYGTAGGMAHGASTS